MIGVTGAQRASAEANTTIDTRPLSVDRSNSKFFYKNMISFFSFEKLINCIGTFFVSRSWPLTWFNNWINNWNSLVTYFSHSALCNSSYEFEKKKFKKYIKKILLHYTILFLVTCTSITACNQCWFIIFLAWFIFIFH